MTGITKKIMIVAGTRPEAIKLAPVIEWLDKLKVEYVFVWSGQHYDYEMSRIFFEQLGLPEIDENLNVRSSSHSEQTAKIMIKLDKLIKKHKPSIVLAEGDTNTVVATAITASKLQFPFAHLEAGLRSWDRRMPEELNRVIADAIAEIHFAPTKLAAINLMHEGIPRQKIYITGNTIVDVTIKYKNRAIREGKELIEEFNIQPRDYLLITLHRQENTESPQRLANIIKALIELAKSFKLVFPIHPRTLIKLKQINLYNKLKNNENIKLLKPLGYFQFLGLLVSAKIVLTDSGGVQEEACTLKIPTITLRYNTERPETVQIGINKIVGTEPQRIVNETMRTIQSYDKIMEKVKKIRNPLGEGNAGEKTAKILKTNIENKIEIQTVDNREDPYITYVLYERTEIDIKRQIANNRYDYIAFYDKNGLSVTNPTDAAKIILRLPLSKALFLKSLDLERRKK